MFIKSHEEIKGVKYFDNKFLYTAYAEDTAFLLREKIWKKIT